MAEMTLDELKALRLKPITTTETANKMRAALDRLIAIEERAATWPDAQTLAMRAIARGADGGVDACAESIRELILSAALRELRLREALGAVAQNRLTVLPESARAALASPAPGPEEVATALSTLDAVSGHACATGDCAHDGRGDCACALIEAISVDVDGALRILRGTK